MEHWEYKLVLLFSDIGGNDDPEGFLNDLGENGWDAVGFGSFTILDDDGEDTTETYLLMKRRKS